MAVIFLRSEHVPNRPACGHWLFVGWAWIRKKRRFNGRIQCMDDQTPVRTSTSLMAECERRRRLAKRRPRKARGSADTMATGNQRLAVIDQGALYAGKRVVVVRRTSLLCLCLLSVFPVPLVNRLNKPRASCRIRGVRDGGDLRV
jgi:hypothetical protein